MIPSFDRINVTYQMENDRYEVRYRSVVFSGLVTLEVMNVRMDAAKESFLGSDFSPQYKLSYFKT